MAAEPTTIKTTLAVAAVAALGPLAGEYALILMGAFGGSLLALHRADPMPKWWQPLAHVGGGVVAGLMFGGGGSAKNDFDAIATPDSGASKAGASGTASEDDGLGL